MPALKVTGAQTARAAPSTTSQRPNGCADIRAPVTGAFSTKGSTRTDEEVLAGATENQAPGVPAQEASCFAEGCRRATADNACGEGSPETAPPQVRASGEVRDLRPDGGDLVGSFAHAEHGRAGHGRSGVGKAPGSDHSEAGQGPPRGRPPVGSRGAPAVRFGCDCL